jgi:capsular polysaccharide transport system permease protein
MTTKPKAKKFRIRRSPTAAVAESHPAPDERPDPAATERPRPVTRPVDEGALRAAMTAREDAAQAAESIQGEVASPGEARTDTDIDAIRREGLTGRQLRMARRVAQNHNLPATSDFDAVRLLREAGIDPFQRTNMLELVVPQRDEDRDDEDKPARIQLPQTVQPGKQTLPSTEVNPIKQRMREIGDIQRDIARRRRRKLALLATRLAFFVLLPTLIAGWYFNSFATPMYSTKSEFLILKADNSGGGGLGGLLSGTQFATSQDSIAVQSYLQSKDAMLRLDRDVGFKSHFTQEWIDPIQRLGADPSNEEAYKLYQKNVKIGYDPTEGVIRMQVDAADPDVAAEYSRALISYAEERVNHLSEQKREDQMDDALRGFERAQADRQQAQEALVQLQQKGAVLDPEGVIASLRSQINGIEMQLQEKQLQLAALMDNARPNKAKVDGTRADIGRLEDLLDTLNTRMIDASKGENSLAQLSVRIQMAQADLVSRDMMLQSALQQVEQTRMEANRQVRYLTTSVEPVASQEPSYPRKFENTVLAFLIFSGIYLMISLTASILREQVSS